MPVNLKLLLCCLRSYHRLEDIGMDTGQMACQDCGEIRFKGKDTST